MRIKLSLIKLGDKLQIFTANGLFTGTVIDIIEAGTWPDSGKIHKYYSLNEQHKYFKTVCRSLPVDRIIILKDEGGYFVLPRVDKADRYLLDIKMVTE